MIRQPREGNDLLFHGAPLRYLLYLNMTRTPYEIRKLGEDYHIILMGEPFFEEIPTVKRRPRDWRHVKINKQKKNVKKFKRDNPRIVEQLEKIKDDFLNKHRKIRIHCPIHDKYKPLEGCLVLCPQKCDQVAPENIRGPRDTDADIIDALVNLRAIGNRIYYDLPSDVLKLKHYADVEEQDDKKGN